MRVDVDKIFEEVARDREQRAHVERKALLVDVVRETRVIAELACWPDLLEQCETLEVDDFTDFRNQAVLAVMRKLQHKNGDFSSTDLLDALSASEGLVYYVGTICIAYPARLDERGLREFTQHLRSLAEVRRQL